MLRTEVSSLTSSSIDDRSAGIGTRKEIVFFWWKLILFYLYIALLLSSLKWRDKVKNILRTRFTESVFSLWLPQVKMESVCDQIAWGSLKISGNNKLNEITLRIHLQMFRLNRLSSRLFYRSFLIIEFLF